MIAGIRTLSSKTILTVQAYHIHGRRIGPLAAGIGAQTIVGVHSQARNQGNGWTKEDLMPRSTLSRRDLLKTTAITAAVPVSTPYVRHSYAAGKLALGVWER
jgi:hypothetical protein